MNFDETERGRNWKVQDPSNMVIVYKLPNHAPITYVASAKRSVVW